MFDFLKKKISSFTEKVKEKIESKTKQEDASGEEIEKPVVEIQARAEKTPEPVLAEEPVTEETTTEQAEEQVIAEPTEEPAEIAAEEPAAEERAKEEEATLEPETKEPRVEEPGIKEPAPEEPVGEKPVAVFEPEKMQAPGGEEKKPIEKIREIRGEEKRKLNAKVSIKEKLKGFVTGSITVDEKDVTGFLDEFELALLESDVEQDTASEIVSKIREDIVGKKIQRGKDVSAVLKDEIKKSLSEVMETGHIDLLKKLEEKKPYIMLFLGPNGAGKTTSISKLTHFLQGRGKKVIWAASDTFRAASIEQLEKHAEKLGVRVVKHNYGADPAAVAFDAIRAAEAKGIDVVMIDSAGRQDTNKNLLEELKKINRVSKADLRIYVGEAFTGQALLEQAGKFNEALGIDGFVLTKIDTDAKGGTAISLLHKLKKPILYIGTGQRYEDILEFRPEYIIDRIVA